MKLYYATRKVDWFNVLVIASDRKEAKRRIQKEYGAIDVWSIQLYRGTKVLAIQ